MMAKATEPSLCELSSIALPSDSSNFFAKLIICPKTTPPSWSFVPLCESTFLSENERIPRFSRFAMIIAFLLFLIAPSSATGENDALLLDEPVCQAEAVDVATADTATEQKRKVHPDCGLVMAPSTLGNGTSGWGIFALHDMEKGQPVISGDVVIQLTDLAPENVDPGMRLALHDYIWSAEETGGFYEAVHTVSVIPGVGMLANGMEGRHNILPSTPDVDEAGLTRTESAGAGSVTHYHNYTFFIQKPVHAGNEILINYGANWFRERQDRLQLQPEIDRFVASRDVDWLRQHGQCLDNLKPVARSIMPGAGRGVVATRNLVTGTIVAPVPLLPMKRETLQIARKLKSNGSTVRMHQLFLNYCFGHNQSSLLLYPYGPMIKYVLCVWRFYSVCTLVGTEKIV